MQERMEQHEIDLNIEKLTDEMRYKMYEIDTIKDAIVAQQHSVIETLKGRLDHAHKIISEDKDLFLLEKEKFAKEKMDLEIAQARFEVEKENYIHLVTEANKTASNEKERARTLAGMLYDLKVEMSNSIKSLDECLDRDLDDAISNLQRVRAESNPYGV